MAGRWILDDKGISPEKNHRNVRILALWFIESIEWLIFMGYNVNKSGNERRISGEYMCISMGNHILMIFLLGYTLW